MHTCLYTYIHTYMHSWILIYKGGLKGSYDDVISGGDDFFDQWDPSTATVMEKVYEMLGGTILKNKPHLVTFYESILLSRWTLHPTLAYICIYIYIFTYPSIWAGCDTRSVFKWSLTDLNSEFFLLLDGYHTWVEEPSLPYYLPIARGRIIGVMLFPRILVLCEMQTAFSKIWTQVTKFIS